MIEAVVIAVLFSSQSRHAPPVPAIMSREEWGANAPVIDLVPHHAKYITVHHAGTARKKEPSFAQRLRNLQSWSQRDGELAGGKKKPKWSDIPYHYYIDWDGTIAECRQVIYPGDTNTSYDVWGHVLICLEGNLSEDAYTQEQRNSLRELTTWLSWRHRVSSTKIMGHKDYAPGETACPGDAAYADLPALRSHVLSVLGR